MRSALARMIAVILGLVLFAPVTTHVAAAATLQPATISVSPTTYYVGDTVKIAVDFPTSTYNGQVYGNAPVLTLYADFNDGQGFKPVASQAHKKSTSSGTYTFSYVVTKAQKVKVMNDISAAYAGGGQVTTPIVTLSPKLRQQAELFLNRVLGTSNAQVTGTLKPGLSGQKVSLQYLNGSTWTQLLAKTTTDTTGNVSWTASLATLKLTSQYSYKQFRLVGAATGNYVQVISPTIRFMPGPSSVGTYVMRIRTAKNVYPSTKGVKIPGTASMETKGGTTETAALEYIDLRGNSTASLAKKPYKLKFDDDVNPFGFAGLSKAKRFNLLAMFIDNAMVRDKMGLDLGRKLAPNLEWTPGNLYTEVFVNDLYVGLYLLTDAPKITDSAKPAKQRVQVTDVTKGALLVVDGNSVSSGLFGYKTSHGVTVVFDDPDERKYNDDGTVDQEGYTDAKLAKVKAKVNGLEAVLYGSKSTGFLNKVSKYLDIDSAIDYYLVKEFTRDHDADFYRSHYFYVKDLFAPTGTGDPNGIITFGPVWDFDRSAGVISDTTAAAKYAASSSGWYMRPGSVYTSSHLTHNTHWFVQLTKSSEFIKMLRERWNGVTGVPGVKSKFQAVGGTSFANSDVNAAKTLMGVAATNDWNRWKSTSKRYSYRSSPATITGEMEYAAKWYRSRYSWINSNINK